MSMVPGETCFNLNFTNPGSNSPCQSLLLTPKETSSTEEGVMGGECESSSPQLQHQVNEGTPTLPNGKKTKGRVKIKMEYIGNKLRRYTTFSKRKTGIMKKAYELSTLTGTQVMLLVASETGHVYTFATKKLRPMISSEAGKTLIRNCLNTPDIDDAVDPIGARQEFTFEPQPNISRKRKLNECPELPTMVHPTVISASPTCNPEEAENSDGGESESVDSHDAVIEESETDKEKEKATSLSLQQTLKEALRVAAAQRQLQKSKAKINNTNDVRSVINNSNNNNRNYGNNAHNGTTGNIATNTNVQATATFPLLAPFLLPGLNSASTTNNTIMYQIPQGVVYTNDEGADNTSLFANGNGSNNNSCENQQTSQQFMFPINSLTLQQSLLQIMSTAALSAAQLENSERSS
ncbi:SRF-type transcription factor (DNA-binding and dimerization domain) family protein [Brugia pahangi]|uniref:Serum response factor homolog n=6 Tax=Brugia TaxID=6278 RepID=A0A7I4KDJ1_BRUMA